MALALVVVAARLVQFVCAMILCGCPFFRLCRAASPAPAGLQRLLRFSGACLILGASVTLSAQTAVMTDSIKAAFDPRDIWDVVTSSQFGRMTAVRAGLAMATLIGTLAAPSSLGPWIVTFLLGAGVVASFAWTGHGGVGEGLFGIVHLVVDVLHLLSAAVWIGALVCLCMLLFHARRTTLFEDFKRLYDALQSFSGIGLFVVVIVLATGFINGVVLVGVKHVGALSQTLYGLLLLTKAALFLMMVGLAAINRYVLTPRLLKGLDDDAGEMAKASRDLLRTLGAETFVAALVLVAVSVLGTLEPPS